MNTEDGISKSQEEKNSELNIEKLKELQIKIKRLSQISSV